MNAAHPKDSAFDKQVISAFTWVTLAQALGFALAGAHALELPTVMLKFPWSILIICVSLDLFTNLVADTGVMEKVAVRVAQWSGGRQGPVLVIFAVLLFIVSSILNNLTAVLVILPIIFALLRAMDLSPFFVSSFFSLMLAISNVAGASTPIGDFPAILILGSGLTTFPKYLFRAFPLFLFTGTVLVIAHLLFLRVSHRMSRYAQDGEQRTLGVHFLAVQHRHRRVDKSTVSRLAVAFGAMFLAWSVLPGDKFPPETVALAGLGLAVLLTRGHGVSPGIRGYDLTSIFKIGAFLFIAALASGSGVLEWIADALQRSVHDPGLLLLAVMGLTAVLSGLISAGPSAAVMLPIIQSMTASGGIFEVYRDDVAVAFAASICAGSSLFVWSATAGLMLADKVRNGNLADKNEHELGWGVKSYLGFGIVHFVIQLGLGVMWTFMRIPLHIW